MAKMLVTFGPLVAIVDAVSWQDYMGGIIQHHCSRGEANHAVVITGFDKTGTGMHLVAGYPGALPNGHYSVERSSAVCSVC